MRVVKKAIQKKLIKYMLKNILNEINHHLMNVPKISLHTKYLVNH